MEDPSQDVAADVGRGEAAGDGGRETDSVQRRVRGARGLLTRCPRDTRRRTRRGGARAQRREKSLKLAFSPKNRGYVTTRGRLYALDTDSGRSRGQGRIGKRGVVITGLAAAQDR